MNNADLIIVDDLAHAFCKIFERFYKESSSPKISFFATGGSQANLCYPLLADTLASMTQEHFGVDLFLGDERLVPVRNQASNTLLIDSLLFGKRRQPWQEVSFYSPAYGAARELEELVAVEDNPAKKTDEGLKDALRLILSNYDKLLSKSQTPRFVHLGLGPDGHVASLFPDTSNLGLALEHCQISIDTSGRNPHYRISMTMEFINQSDLVVLSVSTKEKGLVLAKVFDDPKKYPAGQLDPKKLIILADRQASLALGRPLTATGFDHI